MILSGLHFAVGKSRLISLDSMTRGSFGIAIIRSPPLKHGSWPKWCPIIRKHNGIDGGGDREVGMRFGLPLEAKKRQYAH